MAQNYNGFGSGGGGIKNDLYLHLYRWPFYISFVTEASSYVIKSHEWMNEWDEWQKLKEKYFFLSCQILLHTVSIMAARPSKREKKARHVIGF